MTDYIEIFDTQLDPDAPITSGLGYQFRNNPVAISEGSPGSPRNSPGSLVQYSISLDETLIIPSGSISGGTYFCAISTDSSTGSRGIYYETSTDGGVTWGNDVIIIQVGGSEIDFASGTDTFPAGTNAIRLADTTGGILSSSAIMVVWGS